MTDAELEKINQSLKPHWREVFDQIPSTGNPFYSQNLCGLESTPQKVGAALTALAKRGLLEKTKWTEDAAKSASYKLTSKGVILQAYNERQRRGK